MGLDQYAYVTANPGDREEFWENATKNHDTKEWSHPDVSQPREIAYWRKHPNLQGWMKRLWESKGSPGLDKPGGVSFNGVEVELTWEDLEQLERDIKSRSLPETTGFFFGENSDDHYYKEDLQFVFNAKAEVFCGLKVFYNSSW
jgi:hypothetical protein